MSEPKTTEMVHLHTQIGNREGVILELRQNNHDNPRERDMSHLSDEKAREVRDELDAYLGENND